MIYILRTIFNLIWFELFKNFFRNHYLEYLFIVDYIICYSSTDRLLCIFAESPRLKITYELQYR